MVYFLFKEISRRFVTLLVFKVCVYGNFIFIFCVFVFVGVRYREFVFFIE